MSYDTQKKKKIKNWLSLLTREMSLCLNPGVYTYSVHIIEKVNYKLAYKYSFHNLIIHKYNRNNVKIKLLY